MPPRGVAHFAKLSWQGSLRPCAILQCRRLLGWFIEPFHVDAADRLAEPFCPNPEECQVADDDRRRPVGVHGGEESPLLVFVLHEVGRREQRSVRSDQRAHRISERPQASFRRVIDHRQFHEPVFDSLGRNSYFFQISLLVVLAVSPSKQYLTD